MAHIGIDIGKDGGVAAIDEAGKLHLRTIPKIGKEIDVSALVDVIRVLSKLDMHDTIICMEDVHSIAGSSAKSNFSFGESKGLIEGIIASLGLPYQKVAPKQWQKVCWEGVLIQKKPDGSTNTKATSLISAKRLFPSETFLATSRSSVPHDGLVDAALIAKYCKIKHG